MSLSGKQQYIVLFFISLCSLIIRLPGITDYYYHTDELIHNFIAQGQSWNEVFIRGMREAHPPLGHFIKHSLYQISDNLIICRLASAACGIGSVILAYLIGRRISPDSYLGLSFAIILAFSKIAVIYTVSIRNYGSFLLFMMAAYYFFISYSQNRKVFNALAYICTTLLACATHFTGFIYTFILSTALGLELLRARKYRQLSILFICHFLHVALLTLFYYFFYIKFNSGSTWYQFYAHSVSLLSDSLVVGVVSLYFGFFLFNITFFAFAFPLTIYGTFLLFKINRAAAFSVIIAFLIQPILLGLHLYTLAGNRYCLYLFPFLALPLAAVFAAALGKLPLKPFYIIAILTISLLVISVWANLKNIYFDNNSEFTTTNQSFSAGVEFLKSEIAPADIILTNKGSWLHLLYLQDKANSGYFPKQLGEMNFNGRQVYFLERRNEWEYLKKEDFYDFLPLVRDKLARADHIWITIFGTSDFALFSLYDCDYVKPHISHVHNARGVLIFQTDKSFVLNNFYPPSPELQSCFINSQQPVLGGLFK